MNKTRLGDTMLQTVPGPATVIKEIRRRKAEHRIKQAEEEINQKFEENRDIREAEQQLEKARKLYREERYSESCSKAVESRRTAGNSKRLEAADILGRAARLKKEFQLFPENSSLERKALIKKAMIGVQEKQGDFNPGQIVTLLDKTYRQIGEELREKIRTDIREMVESDSEISESRTVRNLDFYRLEPQ